MVQVAKDIQSFRWDWLKQMMGCCAQLASGARSKVEGMIRFMVIHYGGLNNYQYYFGGS